LKEFSLSISDADIAFLQALLPDPRTILIASLPEQHNVDETDYEEGEGTREL